LVIFAFVFAFGFAGAVAFAAAFFGAISSLIVVVVCDLEMLDYSLKFGAGCFVAGKFAVHCGVVDVFWERRVEALF